MKRIKTFENFSTDYYGQFKLKEFPKKLNFTNPKMTYELMEIVPGSNKIHITYQMTSDQPEKDNPYSGDYPDKISVDIGITYKESNTKIYVTIVGGNRVWWSFSYEKGEIKDIEKGDIKLTKSSTSKIISVLNKYSSQSLDKL